MNNIELITKYYSKTIDYSKDKTKITYIDKNNVFLILIDFINESFGIKLLKKQIFFVEKLKNIEFYKMKELVKNFYNLKIDYKNKNNILEIKINNFSSLILNNNKNKNNISKLPSSTFIDVYIEEIKDNEEQLIILAKKIIKKIKTKVIICNDCSSLTTNYIINHDKTMQCNICYNYNLNDDDDIEED
jgi:hypothetical protein